MSEELFRDFWWLIFPIFGMVMAIMGMAQEGRRQDAILRDARRQLERDQ
jgi:hypothetical protein